MSVVASRPPVGAMLREWRQRRRLSQFDLALEAGVSARHVSFVETGRSRPSAEMVLHLAEQLEVPLRDRNQLLLAAGYAPAYAQRELDAPELGPVRDAIEQVLRGHEPYPALVVDRHWGLVSANRALAALLGGVARAPARAARQRPPPQPPSRGHGAAHPQPVGVARPSARAPRPRRGHQRGSGARRAARGARGVSGGRARPRRWTRRSATSRCRSASGRATRISPSSARRRRSEPRSTSPSPSSRSSRSSPRTRARRARCAPSHRSTSPVPRGLPG